MNGPDHYRAAERLLESAARENASIAWIESCHAAAQVHATLALAAATAYPAVKDWHGDEDRTAYGWAQVSS